MDLFSGGHIFGVLFRFKSQWAYFPKDICFSELIFGILTKIMLIKFIRNEKKFRNILELKKQIAKDIKIAKQI